MAALAAETAAPRVRVAIDAVLAGGVARVERMLAALVPRRTSKH